MIQLVSINTNMLHKLSTDTKNLGPNLGRGLPEIIQASKMSV